MRNTILALTLALSTTAPAVFADTEVRVLDRVWVTHCVVDNPAPPVVVVERVVDTTGEEIEDTLDDFDYQPGVTVEGESPTTTECTFIDTKVNAADLNGRIMITTDDNNWIEEVIYSATIYTGRTAYGISDWVFTNYQKGNGASYAVESGLIFEENGQPLEYDMSFLRRADANSDDPATIVRVQRETEDGILIFTLVYKPEIEVVDEVQNDL